jgi:hypothetical protein
MFLKNICNAFVIELVSNLDRYVDPAVTSLSYNVVDSLADLAMMLLSRAQRSSESEVWYGASNILSSINMVYHC